MGDREAQPFQMTSAATVHLWNWNLLHDQPRGLPGKFRLQLRMPKHRKHHTQLLEREKEHEQ